MEVLIKILNAILMCIAASAIYWLTVMIVEEIEKRKHKKQHTYCYCDCGNELISNHCLILDSVWVYFKCDKCGRISKWDFDTPVPVFMGYVEKEE